MKTLFNKLKLALTSSSRDKEFYENAHLLWRNEFRSESFDFVLAKLKNGEYSSIGGNR